jgi:hypothetical protein
MKNLKEMILGFVLSCLILAPFAWHYWPFGAISPYTYYRIKLGTTFEQAEKTIGLPPGMHDGRPRGGRIGGIMSRCYSKVYEAGIQAHEAEGANAGGLMRRGWWGTDYGIRLTLNAQGRVVGKSLTKIH